MKTARLILACAIATFCVGMYLNAQAPTSFTVLPGAQGITGATGSTGPTGATGPSGTVTAVNSAITVTSLSTSAVCALHTDTPDAVHACNNAVTDATAANCPAGTLSAPCTFPTSLTIPANSLGSTTTLFYFSIGKLATASIPTSLIEIYLDSVRIYAGTAAALAAGANAGFAVCGITVTTSTSTAPSVTGCELAGIFPASVFGANALLTNTAPAIAIDTTASHVLKVSMAYGANTTGNSAWLYGLRFNQ